MASPPTVVTSRRRQHELLRSWTGWPLTSILIDPTEVAQVREAGWSGTHHRDPETGERIVGTADGLGFGVDDSWHNPVEVIPWSELEAIARAVPDEVRELLVEFRARWRRHQSAYPRFTASAAAIGCGPIVGGEPLTVRQEAYVREHEAFEASGVLPAWEQQRAVLDAERLGLHGQAMGLSAGSEAGDLLELLDDQQLEGDTHRVDSAAAGPAGAEVRACVEDEHGDVTSTDVPDVEADPSWSTRATATDCLGRSASTRHGRRRTCTGGSSRCWRGPGSGSGVGRSGRLECSAGASATWTQHGCARRRRCPLDGDRPSAGGVGR